MSKLRPTRPSIHLLGAVCALATGWAGDAYGAVGIAREANGCAYATIAAALANAIPGDDIWIAPGTYLEDGLSITIDLTISQSNSTCSAATVGNTVTIDGGGKRVFEIGSAGAVIVAMGGLNIVNGSTTDSGGLVLVESGALNLFFSTLSQGHADFRGGCIYVANGGSLRLAGTTVTDCTSGDNGGAIGAVQAFLDIVGTSVISESKSGAEGGGIWAYNSGINLTDHVVVSDNSAEIGGGGLCVPATYVAMTDDASVTRNTSSHGAGFIFPGDGAAIGRLVMVDRSSVTYNTGTAGDGIGIGGGGVRLEGTASTGEVVVELHDEATIAYNTAVGPGGGVHFLGNYNTLELNEGTSVSNNQAATGGGISVFENGPLGPARARVIATGARIDGNTALDGFGGGMLLLGGEHVLTDTRVVNNVATTDGGGIALELGTLELTTSLDAGCDPGLLLSNDYCSEVSDNSAGGNGGGIHVESNLVVHRTAFQRNEATKGGAIHVVAGAIATVDNSLFAVNDAEPTSAAIQVKGLFTADHITAVYNRTVGIRFRPGSFGGIQRSISYANIGADLHTGTVPLGGSCNTFGVVTGTGLVPPFSSADPLFVTTSRGHYRLLPISPAVDACANHTDPDLDLRPRPSGPGSDRGCFER